MPRIIVPVRGQKFPYGYTDEERKEFLLKFSEVAGKMSVEDIAVHMGITEKQVRNFANRSGWSIKYVPNK